MAKTTETLDQSWNLLEKIKELKVSAKLKELIDKYIKINTESVGVRGMTSNLYFRAGLHDIIDNHDDEDKLIKTLTHSNFLTNKEFTKLTDKEKKR